MRSVVCVLLLARWDLISGHCLEAQTDSLAYTCIQRNEIENGFIAGHCLEAQTDSLAYTCTTKKLPGSYEPGEEKHCTCKKNCVPFKLTCIRNATEDYWNFPSDIPCENSSFTNIKLEKIDPHLLLTLSNGTYSFECEDVYELSNANDNVTCTDGKLRHDTVHCKLQVEDDNISNYILLAIGLMAVTLLILICVCLRYHGRNRAKTLQSRFTSFSYSTRSTQDEFSNMNEPSPSLGRKNLSRENSRSDLKNNKMFII